MAKNKAVQTNWFLRIKGIIFISLLIFLFYPPFLRGLFFPETQHGALIFASILFWLTWKLTLDKKQVPVLGYKMDFLVLTFVLVYIAATIGAANFRLALNEVTKVALYFLVYWMVSRNILASDNKKNSSDLIIKTLYFSGVGVALAGLMTATGIIDILDGYQFGRIASTLQYANATGGYLVAVLMLGFYLWLSGNDRYKYLYVIGNYTALTIFFATQSRGALLVFIPTLILIFVGISKSQRKASALNVLFLLVIAVVINTKLLDFVEAGSAGVAWLWFIFGGVLAFTLQWWQNSKMFLNFYKKKGFSTVLGVVAFLIIAGITFGIISNLPIGEQLGSAFNYVKEIKLTSRNSMERQHFYKDAFTMIKDKPLLGHGGGGWQAAYKAYQSYFYSSRQVHNHYLQTWVEVGTIGILVLLGIWVMFFYRIYMFWKERTKEWDLIWLSSLAAFALGVHAFIDFDLSLSALSFVIFSVFGIHTAFEQVPSPKQVDNRKEPITNKINLITPSVISLILLAMAISYLGGQSAARNGTETNSAYVAQEYLNEAISYDPFFSNHYINLAAAYAASNNFNKAIEFGEQAHSLDKYNTQISTSVAGYHLQVGNYDQGLKLLEDARQNDRFNFRIYEGIARFLFLKGQNSLTTGLEEEAKASFEKVLLIENDIKTVLEEVDETERWLWDTGSFPKLQTTPFLSLNLGSSYYFLGEFDKAQVYLEKASADQNLLGEVYLWQSLINHKLGKIELAEAYKKEAFKLMPPIQQDYDRLQKLPILK